MKHSVEYRVYYEDTDAIGIMYHARYISFCERGRSEFLRDIGLPVAEVPEKLNIQFVIRHLDANYLKMVKLDDLLTVETQAKTIKNSSFVMKQAIFCQNTAVFTMDITIVCVDNDGKPVRIPDDLRKKLSLYMKDKDV